MHQNHLAGEKSPYLLQHKDNPVWWFPWSVEAFNLAKKENKIIFLSVGYSTCHWCHVMEKDSFEKNDVADVLNANYISIKLDREERPDIDSTYMNAVQALNGSGGWPMTVLLTPDGKPFWGGTFIPHDNLIDLLNKVTEVWRTEPKNITEGSDRLAQFLRGHADLPAMAGGGAEQSLDESALRKFYEVFRSRFDNIYGASQGAPKFPPSLSLSLLLRVYRRTGAAYPLQMVEKTLDQMRRGGIYDQLGGGFHRYAVDDHWLVPHFEKMLYDNALLTQVYLEAYQVTQRPEYARTATETLEYVLRDMTDRDGGFYSAEDADSEHLEGKFYVWSLEELTRELETAELSEITKTFHVTPQGNFHAHKTGDEVTAKRLEPPALIGNVLFIEKNQDLPSKQNAVLQSAMKKLFTVRSKRIRPHLDDKILVSWNSLMISAFTKGYQVLGDERYLAAAKKAANFILSQMRDADQNLARSYRQGVSPHRAMADDYATLIEACLNLYETDFDSKWFENAEELQRRQDHLFYDTEKKAYFENDGTDPLLITRHKNFEDGVVPSSNSVSALNLVRLGALTGNLEYEKKARNLIQAAGALIEQYPQASPKLLQTIDWLTDSATELAVAEPTAETEKKKKETQHFEGDFFSELWSRFRPNMVTARSGATSASAAPAGVNHQADLVPLLKDRAALGSKITFYVCKKHVCKLPTNDAQKTLRDLDQLNQYGL